MPPDPQLANPQPEPEPQPVQPPPLDVPLQPIPLAPQDPPVQPPPLATQPQQPIEPPPPIQPQQPNLEPGVTLPAPIEPSPPPIQFRQPQPDSVTFQPAMPQPGPEPLANPNPIPQAELEEASYLPQMQAPVMAPEVPLPQEPAQQPQATPLSSQPIVPTPSFASIASHSQQSKSHKKVLKLVSLLLVALVVLGVGGYFAYNKFLKGYPAPEVTIQAAASKLLQVEDLAYSASLIIKEGQPQSITKIETDFKVAHLDNPQKQIVQQVVKLELSVEEESSVILETTLRWHGDKAYLRLDQLEIGERPPNDLVKNNVTDTIANQIKGKWLVFDVDRNEVVAHQPSVGEDVNFEDLDEQIVTEFFNKRSVDGLVTFIYKTLLTQDGVAKLAESLSYTGFPFSHIDDQEQRARAARDLFGKEADPIARTLIKQCQDADGSLLRCDLAINSSESAYNHWTPAKQQTFYLELIEDASLGRLSSIFSVDGPIVSFANNYGSSNLEMRDSYIVVDQAQQLPKQLLWTSSSPDGQLELNFEINYDYQDFDLNLPESSQRPNQVY